MSNCKVHNVRFYEPKPKAVYCMSLNLLQKKLALSRSDASIEIWNLNYSPFIERTIASTRDNYSIEGLEWYKDRLFSVGLHGLLVEYDLKGLKVKNTLVVTGEAAFCLNIKEEKQEIAIGTEQGYINIFQICNEEVYFNKFLDKQEGRILCLKYDSSGKYIVSGGLDAIRVWSVETGHAIHKMTTGRSEANKPTIVWCLAVTNDFTIISGDSTGKLTFWDGKIGSQIESYQSHRADILAVALSADQKSLFCSGVDPNITNYVKITVKDDNEKWVKSVHRRIHDHDVRVLALCENRLYSAGMDGYLACSYHPPRTLLKYPPILQNPCVVICPKARLIMLRYPKTIEIWNLGTSDDTEEKNGVYPLRTEPKKLVQIHRMMKNVDGEDVKEGIIFSVISNDGKYIAYGTAFGVRILQLIFDSESAIPRLLAVENTDESDDVHIQGVFNELSTQLITATSSGSIKIYNIQDTVCLIQVLEANEIEDTVAFLKISANGRYLVAADALGNIAVWTMKGERWSSYCKLPKYSVPPTALEMHPKTMDLVVVYADNKIVEYDIKNRQLTKFSRELEHTIPQQWSSRQYPIRNITFDPQKPHIIVLHDDNSIIVIDKTKDIPNTNEKIPRIDSSQVSSDVNESSTKSYQHAFHSIKKYKHLVHLQRLSDDELVAVEVNPLSLMKQLPPCLIRNKFGTK